MHRFQLTLQFPAGGVLIGGYSAGSGDSHAIHAQDKNGVPIIPATAIRGALRETLEALLRGAGEEACSGGNGLRPKQVAPSPVPCILDHGNRCNACQLFGTQRAAIESKDRAFSELILGEARPVPGSQVQWSLRPGVCISRQNRSAEDKLLFVQKVVAGGGTEFVAEGHLLTDQLKNRLDAAVKSTTHIGAGRSRGLARVVMKLDWVEASAAELPAWPQSGDVRIRVTLTAQASIGVPVVEGNHRETRHEFPGAALRGAIGFALAGSLPDPSDESFQSLVAENGAQFGFLYPASSDPNVASGPLPLTAAACKYYKEQHGIIDTLLDRLAIAHIQEPAQAERVKKSRLQNCTCNGPLHSLGGARGGAERLETRTVTRVAIDRTHASARDQSLFSLTMIEPGVVFEGTIRNIPELGRKRLKEALSLPLFLGRGRSAGYGRVRIEVMEPSPIESIEVRGQKFDQALRQRLLQDQLPVHHIGHLVPITLLSPLLTDQGPEKDDGANTLVQALQATSCYLRARRFSREGGWDQRAGQMQGALGTAAGGIFVIDLGPQRAWRDVLPLLLNLEQQGVGNRRHQGYGRVMCFDPFILSRTFTRRTMTSSSDDLRDKRKDLVKAAEDVIESIFMAPGKKLALKKTQLNHLVAICGEAACVEEIENYLRYQAGRGADKTGWDLTLVKNVIGGITNISADLSDQQKLNSWRLYAVYMTRAFTYQDARKQPNPNSASGRASSHSHHHPRRPGR